MVKSLGHNRGAFQSSKFHQSWISTTLTVATGMLPQQPSCRLLCTRFSPTTCDALPGEGRATALQIPKRFSQAIRAYNDPQCKPRDPGHGMYTLLSIGGLANLPLHCQVLQCLQQMIQARVQNMRSGWRTMFGVFQAASKVLTGEWVYILSGSYLN